MNGAMHLQTENFMTNPEAAKAGNACLTLFQIAARMEVPGFPRFNLPALARRKRARIAGSSDASGLSFSGSKPITS
jgi:hypothetical protein